MCSQSIVNTIIKFADDATIRLICDNSEHLTEWYYHNNVDLNIKEMIVDLRKSKCTEHSAYTRRKKRG